MRHRLGTPRLPEFFTASACPLRTRPLPGHTLGHAGLRVESAGERLHFAGENFGHVQRHGDAYRWVPLA